MQCRSHCFLLSPVAPSPLLAATQPFMTTEGRRLGYESELVAMKDTFVQPYDTALCSLARETADHAGRAKVTAVECHSRPDRLAPHKSKSSKRFKSRLSAPRHLHAPTSTAHSPLPPSPASVASQTEVAYPASLHRQAESTLAQPSQLSSHVESLSDDAKDPPTTHRSLLLFRLTNTNEAVHSLPPPTPPHPSSRMHCSC